MSIGAHVKFRVSGKGRVDELVVEKYSAVVA